MQIARAIRIAAAVMALAYASVVLVEVAAEAEPAAPVVEAPADGPRAAADVRAVSDSEVVPVEATDPCEGLTVAGVAAATPDDEHVDACGAALFERYLERHGPDVPCPAGGTGASTSVSLVLGVPHWWQERFDEAHRAHVERCAGA